MSIRADNQSQDESAASPHVRGAVDFSASNAGGVPVGSAGEKGAAAEKDGRAASGSPATAAAAGEAALAAARLEHAAPAARIVPPAQAASAAQGAASEKAASAELSSELDGFLAALRRDENLHVVKLLKASPHETTELVRYTGANGAALGTLVRKRFVAASGLGSAYGVLLRAQQEGRRFQHVPRVEVARREGDAFVVLMEYVRGVTLAELVRCCDSGSDEKGVGASAAGAGSAGVGVSKHEAGTAHGSDAGEAAALAQALLAQGGGARLSADDAAPPRLALTLRVFPQLCDAVSELHEGLPTPLIHRDIKPENVVVTPAGVPVLIDFGIARSYRSGASTDTVHFGTADYAPPEQYGFGQTDIRSDVYALGLVLWFCLTGRVPAPFDRELAYTDPAVPEPLRQVIVRAAAFDPANRYPSARALAAAFGEACHALAAGGPDAADAFAQGRAPGARPRGSRGVDEAEASSRRGADAPAGASGAGMAPEVVTNPKPVAEPRRTPSVPGPRAAASGRETLRSPGVLQRLRATAAERGNELLARVPTWVGRVWNVLLVLFYLLFVAGCVQAVVHPNEQDAGYPVWFLVMEYLAYLAVLFTMLFVALLDKRRLRQRFPQLPWPASSLRLLGQAALFLVAGIAAVTVVMNVVVLPLTW